MCKIIEEYATDFAAKKVFRSQILTVERGLKLGMPLLSACELAGFTSVEEYEAAKKYIEESEEEESASDGTEYDKF